MQPSIIQRYKEIFPHLVSRTSFVYKHSCDLIQVPFKNQKCTAWIQEDYGEGFIVGINGLHSHFNYKDKEVNSRTISMEDALSFFNEIIIGNYIAYFEIGKEQIATTKERELEYDEKNFPSNKYELIYFE